MRTVLYILFALLTSSCSKEQKFIYYEFDKVVVTRMDKGNSTYFYYGKYKKEQSLPKSYIKASYRGFDGVIDAYMIFHSDSVVEIIPVGDKFEKVGNKNLLVLNDTVTNIRFSYWLNEIQGNYNNVFHLSHVPNNEKKWNKENNSLVKVVYNDN